MTGKTRRVICVETGQVFNSLTEAGAFVGVSSQNISAAVRGKASTSVGYHWKYAPDDLKPTVRVRIAPVNKKRKKKPAKWAWKAEETTTKVERPRSRPSMTIYEMQEEARRRSKETGRFVRYADLQKEETLRLIREGRAKG